MEEVSKREKSFIRVMKDKMKEVSKRKDVQKAWKDKMQEVSKRKVVQKDCEGQNAGGEQKKSRSKGL